MAIDKNTQYNQLAWQLEQLKQEYYNQGGSGQLGGGNLLKEAEFKQGSAEVLGQIQKIQAQMSKLEPTLSGNPQDYIQAPINVQNQSDELTSLLNNGVSETDPRAQALISDIKQQTELVNKQSDYNNQLQTLRSGSQDYIKSQKGLQTTQQNADKQIADIERQIAKLQTQKVVDGAAGKDTSAIENQINTLQAQNQKEQVAYFNAKSESTPLDQEFVANATHTAPIPAGTNAGPNAVVANNQKIATTKPSVTPPVDPAAATAATIAAAIAKANGGNYTTSKGILSLNDNPYSGEYQGKYYTNGKLETTAQIKADFISKYGQQAKFIASVPEINDLLTTAINKRWAPTEWAIQFGNTKWSAAHPGDIGLAEILRISEPQLYAVKYNTAQSHIASLAASTGMKLTPQQLGAQITDPTKATSVALDQEAVNGGQDLTNWLMQNPTASDTQIVQQMAKYGTIDPTTGPGGNIKTFSNNLQNLAQQYGVLGQVSTDGTSKVFDNLAVKEAASGANLSDPAVLAKYENQYRTQAMATYKPFADQIANGAKVSDLASPYLNTYANLMEVSPSDIQLGALTGPGALVSKALVGDANGQVVNPYDFASQVRSQPGWLNTQNAHNTLNSAADYMINKMGMG